MEIEMSKRIENSVWKSTWKGEYFKWKWELELGSGSAK
jgi:hypothetical protein